MIKQLRGPDESSKFFVLSIIYSLLLLLSLVVCVFNVEERVWE